MTSYDACVAILKAGNKKMLSLIQNQSEDVDVVSFGVASDASAVAARRLAAAKILDMAEENGIVIVE